MKKKIDESASLSDELISLVHKAVKNEKNWGALMIEVDTILTVEEKIREMDYPIKTELWRALPKKVMYQTFSLIIDYLEDSEKILTDKDGRIVWIWNPELVKKALSSGVKLR